MRKLITSIIMTGVVVFVSAQVNSPREISELHDQKVFENSKTNLSILSLSSISIQTLDSVWYRSYDFNAGTWKWDEIHHFTYNSNGLCASEMTIDNAMGLGRLKSDLIIYAYNAQGLLTTEYNCTWNLANWDTIKKYEYNYDSYNRYAGSTEYIYQNGTYIPFWKSERSYDTHGFISRKEYFDWTGGTWVGYSKHEMTNFSDGRIIEEVIFNKPGYEYVEDEKDVYTYNMQKMLIEMVNFNWTNGGWANIRRSEFVCNASCQLISTTLQSWQNNSWHNTNKFEFGYDASGNRNAMVQYEWTGQWDKEVKRSLLFNQNIPFNQLRYPWSFSDEITGMRLSDNWYYWNGLNWRDDQHHDYYWTNSTIGIAEVEILDDINIYPIPTSDQLHVEWQSGNDILLQLFDLTGSLIIERHLQTGRTSFDMSIYSKGVYLLRLEHNGSTTVKKLIVQ